MTTMNTTATQVTEITLEQQGLTTISNGELAQLKAIKALYERINLPLMAAITHVHLRDPVSFDQIVSKGVSKEHLFSLQGHLPNIMNGSY